MALDLQEEKKNEGGQFTKKEGDRRLRMKWVLSKVYVNHSCF